MSSSIPPLPPAPAPAALAAPALLLAAPFSLFFTPSLWPTSRTTTTNTQATKTKPSVRLWAMCGVVLMCVCVCVCVCMYVNLLLLLFYSFFFFFFPTTILFDAAASRDAHPQKKEKQLIHFKVALFLNFFLIFLNIL